MNIADRWLTTDDGMQIYARDYRAGAGRGTVVCLHGLTRNSLDFRTLAEGLADQYRVLAIDQRGRGKSSYDPNNERYNLATYVADSFAMLDSLSIESIVLIGTSMGGLMAMMMAAMQPDRIDGIILNDIGPVVETDGIARIQGYVGSSRSARDWHEAAELSRANNEIAFPDWEDDQWLTFARKLYVEKGGEIIPAYDPAISEPMKTDSTAAVPADVWPLFEAMEGKPLLVFRGELSDILSAETVAEMAARHSEMQSVVISGRGHAPTLDEPEAAAAIHSFLAQIYGPT